MLVIADGLLISSCETVFPGDMDAAQDPIGERCLDLDPKRVEFVPAYDLYDEVVVAFPQPFFIPIPLRLHRLDSILADFMLYVFFSDLLVECWLILCVCASVYT